MALLLTKLLRNGTSGDYHRISEVYYTNGQTAAMVKVQLWKDSTVRENPSAVPLTEEVFQIELTGTGDVTQRSYAGLKEVSDFAGATDI